MTTTKDALAAPSGLALGMGRSRALIAVAGYEQASRIYRALCERHLEATGQGASTMPEGFLYDTSGASPRRVGYVSWNGRCWAGRPQDWRTDSEPVYSPLPADGGAR